MAKNNIPGNTKPAPAKAENITVNNNKRDLRKEAEARSRARRMRSIMKLGVSKEDIEKMFEQEDNRMILVLLSGQYTVDCGTEKKTVKRVERTPNGKKLVDKEIEVHVVLRGLAAAKKYTETEKINVIAEHKTAIWVLTDVSNVEAISEKLKVLGRVSITKPEKHTQESVKADIKKKNETPKKPSNNTAEAKKAAKANRKDVNKKNAEMRPYYAAKRKGGVSARIKKHNPTLAKKIEKWLEERKKIEAEKADRVEKHKRNYRQLSSVEMKANKRARKAVKHLATQERRKAAEKKRAEYNAKEAAKRSQKAQKPVQTDLKIAA